MSEIVGRKREREELEEIYGSGKAEFVAVYGRRRVGKTYLVKQALKGRITFQHTGVSPVDQESDKGRLRTQLESFYYSLLNHGLEGFSQPKTWMEAFYQLEQLLTGLDNGSRQLIFIDELPWMDTPRSGFISAFENFWNGWCSGRDNLMLVVCGSATSWILSNLSRSKGGLYGRLTHEIKLSPFNLGECEEYFKHQGIAMSRYDILQSYMVFGGIPYYLSYFRTGLSFSMNTDALLFGSKPRLQDEFNRLFRAIFTNAEECKKVVTFLGRRNYGYTREEIAEATGLPLGGWLTGTLNSLIESDFVIRYTPFGKGEATYYKLVDYFCLFWLKHVERNRKEATYMSDNATSEIMRSWRGVAFEQVCWQHVDQIKSALKVGGVRSSVSTWNNRGDDGTKGCQIDMLIFRDDNVVNLCEMKFSTTPYAIDAEEQIAMLHRIEALKSKIPNRTTIHMTLVSTFGLAKGKNTGHIQQVIVADDLF